MNCLHVIMHVICVTCCTYNDLYMNALSAITKQKHLKIMFKVQKHVNDNVCINIPKIVCALICQI